MNGIINVQNLNFSYKKDAPILQNVTFTVMGREILGLTGRSGSGKTSMLYLLKGIIPHAIKGHINGSISVDGMDTQKTKVARLARSVGMVFQDINAQLFSNTVKEEIEFGLRNLNIDLAYVDTALEQLSITELANIPPMNLSMGQKQRVILASVIAMHPKILLLDEPSVHLDHISRTNLMNWLQKLHASTQMTILIASNDPWLIGNLCNETLHIEGTRLTRKPKSDIMELRSTWDWKRN